MNVFSQLKEWIHDLLHGRKIPKRYKYMTVDIQKSAKPLPVVPPKVKPSIRMIQGERIVVLPFDNPDLLAPFAEEHQDMVYRYMLTRFRQAFEYKKPSVMLFQFGSSTKIAQITADKYKSQLGKMLDFFVKIEDYEAAGQCRDLIQGIS